MQHTQSLVCVATVRGSLPIVMISVLTVTGSLLTCMASLSAATHNRDTQQLICYASLTCRSNRQWSNQCSVTEDMTKTKTRPGPL